ncbi:MAG: cytochrome o ubiquinol oxidase protein CyoD [Chlamydiota bacterium]|jgi:cytochrome o ubiquinol oxidase operon protein cyoD
MIDSFHPWNKKKKPLVIGFILSLVLTFGAYALFPGHRVAILVLTMIQVLIQMVFFFQVGLEDKPHWSLIMFLFMLLVAFLIIGGSLWIMSNLDYNMM